MCLELVDERVMDCSNTFRNNQKLSAGAAHRALAILVVSPGVLAVASQATEGLTKHDEPEIDEKECGAMH